MVMQNCMYGFDMTREELEAETLEGLQKSIYSMNGDGCDYIHSVTNLGNDDVIFGEAAVDSRYEESWDEEELFDEE